MQAGAEVDGAMLVTGSSAWVRSAFTKTGITAPVPKRKGRCLMARSKAAMDPEWLVNEINVLLSWVNTSSRRILRRASCAESVSRTLGFHSGSSSAKLGSKVYVGKAL